MISRLSHECFEKFFTDDWELCKLKFKQIRTVLWCKDYFDTVDDERIVLCQKHYSSEGGHNNNIKVVRYLWLWKLVTTTLWDNRLYRMNRFKTILQLLNVCSCQLVEFSVEELFSIEDIEIIRFRRRCKVDIHWLYYRIQFCIARSYGECCLQEGFYKDFSRDLQEFGHDTEGSWYSWPLVLRERSVKLKPDDLFVQCQH